MIILYTCKTIWLLKYSVFWRMLEDTKTKPLPNITISD